MMKVGIKKLQENEWQVHVSCATIKMDRFSIELLNISLAHLMALKEGQVHSMLTSYIHLAAKIKQLDAAGVQRLLYEVNSKDLLNLLVISNDYTLTDIALKNVGGILAKQLESDMQNNEKPEEEAAKASIKRIVEKMFDLEAQGEIEFYSQETQYI